jgi:hypothetical protein
MPENKKDDTELTPEEAEAAIDHAPRHTDEAKRLPWKHRQSDLPGPARSLERVLADRLEFTPLGRHVVVEARTRFSKLFVGVIPAKESSPPKPIKFSDRRVHETGDAERGAAREALRARPGGGGGASAEKRW